MKRIKPFVILSILIAFALADSVAQNAATLLQNMDNLMSAPKDRQGIIEITLTGKNEKEKVREAIMLQKGKDKKLYRYTKPENQAGIATLSLPDDVMWLYMPAFGNPKKISLLAKSQSFTGTDFSYEDMDSKTYSERYDPVLVQPQSGESYVLELKPKSDKSKYSKIVLYLNKQYYYPVKMDYYDKNEVLFKTATYKYLKSGGYWYAEEVLMKDLKQDHSTLIKMKEVKFDNGLKDEDFAVEKMKTI
jgi:outer membrane lipoprotein-sorting protein